MQPRLNLVVAVSREGGIGLKGQLPWKLKQDMEFFKNITQRTSDPAKKNAVIMGRKTWDSIPGKFRPLSNRLNIVLTRQHRREFEQDHSVFIDDGSTIICDSLDHALNCLSWPPYRDTIESTFVIGGAAVYQESLKRFPNHLDIVYVTRVEGEFECDVFVNIDEENLELMNESEEYTEGSIKFRFLEFRAKSSAKMTEATADVTIAAVKETVPSSSSSFSSSSSSDDSKVSPPSDREEEKKAKETGMKSASVAVAMAADVNRNNSNNNEEEKQYLNLIRKVIECGIKRPDRTGVGTLALFGSTMRFSLRDDRFPLLTTKRVFWRGVAEELLWFIRGSTDAKELSAKKIRIWDGNGSRDFLDSRGLTDYEEGDLGPVYGFQWRHFGADYHGYRADYTGQGVDQLATVIEQIKNNPTSRRIVMSAWNPADLSKMALPPCHMFCQFFVANDELSCQMYQRSADMGLGVPFNIASYALLTRLIAQVTGLKPGEFVHCIGDTHVYLNHIDPLREQLKREPRSFPRLLINPNRRQIDDFVYDDFKIEGYKPYPKIAMKMAV